MSHIPPQPPNQPDDRFRPHPDTHPGGAPHAGPGPHAASGPGHHPAPGPGAPPAAEQGHAAYAPPTLEAVSYTHLTLPTKA